LANRCEIKTEQSLLTIRIKPERSWWTLFASPLLIAFIVTQTVELNIGWAGFFVWGLMLWLVWRMIWGAFGEEIICAETSTVSITSQVLGLHRTRRFESKDVEWMAYHPHAYRAASGIGLMLKSRLTPFQFGRELKPADAECLLQAMKTNVGWLAEKVKGATETSFYQLK
jgi:hypothetical protein